MNATLRVTAKGQVTLRRDLLKHLGLMPGDQVTVELLPSGRAELRAARAANTIESFIGRLDSKGISLSIEDMNQVIADGWASGKR